MLPPVDDTSLLDALSAVVANGARLGIHPASEAKVQPLAYLVSARRGEFFSDVAQRILRWIDESLKANVEPLRGDEPLLNEEQSTGLRILFGLHPDYGETSVKDRRVEAAELLFPERGPWRNRADTFYRSWERQALQRALECLRRSYGQEDQPGRRRHESVRRMTSAIIGVNCRQREVVSSHVSRSALDNLKMVRTRYALDNVPEGTFERIEFEPVSGVGSPEVIEEQPYSYILRFPLLKPVYLGEEFSWSYRRKYFYHPDSPPPQHGAVRLTGNVRGYVVAAEVVFEGQFPIAIWKYAVHAIRSARSPSKGQLLQPDGNNRVEYPETSDTYPEMSYGIAWDWV